jgi:hypothetical protein
VKLRQTFFVAIFALMVAGSADAGDYENNRKGFLVGFGVGGGSAKLDSDLDTESGPMGAFRIGFAVSNEVAIALESTAWSKEVDGVTITFSGAGPGVTYYPGTSGVYGKLAVGVGKVEASFGGLTFSESGSAFIGGVGYETRLTRKFALGGELDATFLSIDGLDGTNFIGVNLMFNWYWSDDA